MRRSLAVAFLMLLGSVVSGQQPNFHSASRDLVVLPVTVTDRHGRYVPDLPQDRFIVYDNNRRQSIALFSNEDSPVTVGLLIDSSTSMRPKINEVLAASVAFARTSNPQDEMSVMEFNETVRDVLPDHRFLLASDVDAVETAVSRIRPEGRTALYDGLIAALDRMDMGRHGRKVIVLISDGGDNASRATLDDVLGRARRSNVVVYTLGVFDENDTDRNPGVLKALAQTTGGQRFLPSSAGPLIQACQLIAREIRNTYTIGLEPPDRDGSYHRVRVQMVDSDHQGLTARTREGYVASRPDPPGSGK